MADAQGRIVAVRGNIVDAHFPGALPLACGARGRRRSGHRCTRPVDLHRFHRLEEEPWPSHVRPTFSMDPARLFAALVRQYLFVSLFRACAESQAAEHASRLNAMQSASRNLDDRQAELVGEFRRRRQVVITAELLDVVSGYEALSKPEARRDSVQILQAIRSHSQ